MEEFQLELEAVPDEAIETLMLLVIMPDDEESIIQVEFPPRIERLRKPLREVKELMKVCYEDVLRELSAGNNAPPADSFEAAASQAAEE